MTLAFGLVRSLDPAAVVLPTLQRQVVAGPRPRPLPSRAISRPSDPAELAAERTADTLLTSPAPVPGTLAPAQSRSALPGLGGLPSLVGEVLHSAGSPLDAATRAEFEPLLGQDLSHVRVHAGDQAAASADAVAAHAYTVGSDIVLGRAADRRTLAHELVHAVGSPGAVLERAPLPDESAPRTILILYGTGQLNPTRSDHNAGRLFQLVASQKLRETKARLGKNASKHTIVFEYVPTEIELKNVLNRRYAHPIAEVHLFSHGWDEGVNLGGPEPAGPGPRPKTESDADAQQRRLVKEDLGGYNPSFADDALIVFYGCNVGNVDTAPRPFAQVFADEFGVRATASTRSTHFEPAGGWHQVPDRPGKMRDFSPDPSGAEQALKSYVTSLGNLTRAKAALKRGSKGGILGVMAREDRLRQQIVKGEADVLARRAQMHRLAQFVADPAGVRTKLEAAELAAGLIR